jgi:hypothetical protein
MMYHDDDSASTRVWLSMTFRSFICSLAQLDPLHVVLRVVNLARAARHREAGPFFLVTAVVCGFGCFI